MELFSVAYTALEKKHRLLISRWLGQTRPHTKPPSHEEEEL
jgi:hypothetical protein